MHQNKPLVCSVIIRAFNEDRHIGRLLDGIERQVLSVNVSIETIVVDSGSTDSTVSIATHMGAKVISIAKEEFSFGRALNRGCREATGEILLFASAHVYPVYTDWIEKMIQPFSNSDQVALVYGRQIGNEQTRFSEHEVFAKWFPDQSNYDQKTPFCNNANCAIRKSFWSDQPFNETITGLEDIDWAHKITGKGYRIVYEADAPIVHVHEETPQKIKNRYRREAIAFKQIIPKIKFGMVDFIRLFISNFSSDCFHALKQGVLTKEWKGILMFRYMQFYGTYLGHNQKGEVSRELKNRFYYPNSITRRKKSRSGQANESKKIQYT